ncbi:mirror-image polydactyly gene 1 protein isoform X2 [Lepisosteus oculatus]
MTESLECKVEPRTVLQTQNQNLKDLRIDMYKANPKVNEELKQRLPTTLKYHFKEKLLQHSDLSFQKVEAGSNPLLSQTSFEAGAEDQQAVSRETQRSRVKEEGSVIYLPYQDLELVAVRMSDGQGNLNREPFSATLSLQEGYRGMSPEHDYLSQAHDSGDSSVPAEDSHEVRNYKQTAQSPEDAEEHSTVPSYRRHIAPSHWGKGAADSLKEDQTDTIAGGFLTSLEPAPVLDKEKNIAFLLKELDSMRDLNKKLQDKLAMKEKEVETRQVDAELQESLIEALVAEKAGALVEEIYCAQRERDQAVMARLRLANEERDEALLRARRLQQAATELENINPEENDMDLQELLNRVNGAACALTIERSGAVMADRLHKARDRRSRITAEEMSAVIEERDAALARCKRLEQDLHHLKEQSQTSANNMRHLTAENNQERALKADLELAQKERDRALEHSRKLEEEIQTLRVYYSLHKSLSQEASLREQLGSALGSYEEALRSQEGVVSLAGLHSDQLLAQLQLALAEQANMEAQLLQAQEAQREAHEKVQKLERLVDVLRKKVGAGPVRTVI